MIDVYYFKLHINCIYIQGFNDVYVFTHQPNLVQLYALGRRVICILLTNSFPQGRLLAFVWRHILRAIRGRLIGTQHCKVALMGHLALPQIWPLVLSRNRPLALPRIRPLASPRSRHLALPRSRHLALAQLGQRELVILRLTIKSTRMGSKLGVRSVQHRRPRATNPLMTLSGPVSSHMTW